LSERSPFTMVSWHTLGAVEHARAVQRREVTSAALVEHYIRRIEVLDMKVNAVVVRRFEEAREEAARCDAATARGECFGPLHGVPITVKEHWWLKGARTTNGDPAPPHNDHVASSTAPAVQFLLDAGAVILGKTNLPMNADDFQSYNSVYGRTNNPWNLERIPGGSSGGSAAAMAAGLSALELGTDIGGSIRNPAHYCGVVGHKPSNGIVPDQGLYPGPNHPSMHTANTPHLDPSHDYHLHVGGPLARTCADLELAMRVLARPEPIKAAGGWSFTLPPARVTDVAALRVAVWADDPFCPVDVEGKGMIMRCGARLADAGAHVDYEARPDHFRSNRSAENFFSDITQAWVVQVSLGTGRQLKIDHADYVKTSLQRAAFKRQFRRFFDRGFDVLLCPVMPTSAFPHDPSGDERPNSDLRHMREFYVNGVKTPYFDQAAWAGMIIFADLPSTVVPLGVDRDGLPFGVQIVAREFEDLQTIEVEKMLERLGFRYMPPPGFAADVTAAASRL